MKLDNLKNLKKAQNDNSEKSLEEKQAIFDFEHHKALSEIRIAYSKYIFRCLILYLILILGIVICVGLEWLQLEMPIIVTLISTTTISVVGLVAIVAKWLFPTS